MEIVVRKVGFKLVFIMVWKPNFLQKYDFGNMIINQVREVLLVSSITFNVE